MAERKALGIVDKPQAEMSQAEKLDKLTDIALDQATRIFNLPDDPDGLAPMGLDAQKVLRAKLELVQTVGNLRVRVDDASLRHQERSDLLELMREKLKNIRLPSKD